MAANEYFTYVTGMDNNGEQYAHRTGVQAWIVNGSGLSMTIFVQGPLPDGQYNAFAKKHMMTTTGGEFDGSPEGKLTSISTKRRNDVIAFTDQDREDKLTAMKGLAPKNAQQYVATGAYGAGGIGQGTPLTMIHCDAVTPTKLKEAFRQVILAIKSGNWNSQRSNINQSTNSIAHTNVKFTSDIIYNQLYNQNKITTTNKMSVLVMKGKDINTYHVFHGAPYDATYPNA
jgi:hypothetical protein